MMNEECAGLHGTRHIPQTEITQLGDLGFDRALQTALRPNEAYDVERWLFVPNVYTEYRYILGTRGKRPLICVGINPSTARPEALDPTLQSVQRIAIGNGYDSFLMFNVYAQRATSPDDMDQAICLPLHRENMRAFEYPLSLSTEPTVWAAWGTIIEKRVYLQQCVADMAALAEQHHAKWVCCGKRSKAGHPHHPLYLRSSEKLEAFNLPAYLREMGKNR